MNLPKLPSNPRKVAVDISCHRKDMADIRRHEGNDKARSYLEDDLTTVEISKCFKELKEAVELFPVHG